MLLDALPFAEFREVGPQIIEETVFDGVELDRQKIGLILAGLNARYDKPYAILSNRIHSYSHTHESMQALADEPRLKGMAILVYSSLSNMAAGIHELYQDNVRVFHSRPAALDWLRQILAAGDVSPGRPKPAAGAGERSPGLSPRVSSARPPDSISAGSRTKA